MCSLTYELIILITNSTIHCNDLNMIMTQLSLTLCGMKIEIAYEQGVERQAGHENRTHSHTEWSECL